MLGSMIGFIGSGNMARSIMQGLIHHGYAPKNIIASNRTSEKLQLLVDSLGIIAAQSNTEVALKADVIVLAVKPQYLKLVCQEIAPIIQNRKVLIISLATAVSLEKIVLNLQVASLPVVRTMTNTPTELGVGMTALFANHAVSVEQKQFVTLLFQSVGECFWLEREEEFNIYTPLVGCAPAYIYLWMQSLQEAAIAVGIAKDRADMLVKKVTQGAVALACQSSESLENLRKKVTTPNGVTEASLACLLDAGLPALLQKTFLKGCQRESEIAASLNGN